MFLTVDQMKQAIADTLKVDLSALEAYWTNLATECNRSGYLDVRGALLKRGFLAAQVDAWDRGAEFQRDIGLYWAFVRGVGLHNYDQSFIDKLDRRKELETVMVEIDGGATQLPSGTPAQIGGGVMTTIYDTWTRDTPI